MKSTGALAVRNICKRLFFCSVPAVYFSCLFSLQVWVFNRISVYLLCYFFWHFLFPFLASVQTPNPQPFNTFSLNNYIYKGPEFLHAKLHFTQAVLLEEGEEEEKNLQCLSWKSIGKIKRAATSCFAPSELYTYSGAWYKHQSHSPLHIFSFYCS